MGIIDPGHLAIEQTTYAKEYYMQWRERVDKEAHLCLIAFKMA